MSGWAPTGPPAPPTGLREVDHEADPVSVRAALARPELYPGPVDRVDVRETHISWVFLAGDRAYKLKMPVVLPFLDYRTPQRSREMCREEVRLNRRLARGGRGCRW